MQKFILMNRTHQAALLTMILEPKEGFIHHMEILDIQYLPFPVRYAKKGLKIDAMESWILRRIMSLNRINLKKITELTHKNVMELSLASYGLSVTDGYWFCPFNEKVRWSDINFYDHNFRYDIGNMIFGIPNTSPELLSPDLTTNGQMEKTWRKRDGEVWLLKKGSPPYYEEPFNEKIVSKLLERISKVPFVSYDVVFVCRYAVSVCKNFSKNGVEFVSAADLVKTAEKPSFYTMDEHLRERCRYFEIPDYKMFLDQLKVLDYIIFNYDRHLGNFGFLYDTESGRFLGPAPIFDNGSSLWCQDSFLYAESLDSLATELNEKIKTIRHPEIIELPNLQEYEIREIIESVYEEAAITSERARAISKLLNNRYQIARLELSREIEFRSKRRKQVHGIELAE